MGDFLNFKRMITPVIIQIVFWLGIAGVIIGGIAMVVAGARADEGGGAIMLLGLMWMVLGPIAVRVYCELIILGFSINATLMDIKKLLTNRVP